MHWTLANGEERHAASPEKFEIPEEWERNSIQPGDIVRLLFLHKTKAGLKGEKMWIQVTENLNGIYIGILDYKPMYIVGLKYGDQIAFRPENVIDILPED